MTVWEHAFWLEVAHAKKQGHDKIEFADVDRRAADLSRVVEWVDPKAPSSTGDSDR